ncbi:MAG: hypothetical protein P8Q48_03890 [Paracoccaceae bacterium]|nr:hypothetical protein [Paracoccaceae bacterium]MDG1369376.1 hypothetical protein [Paracoccaceae bacterium]
MNLSRKPRPQLSLGPAAPDLALGRMHEATGPSAVIFAALAAGRLTGPILWARPAWEGGVLNPEGLAPLFDPTRLVVASCPRPLDILWTAEEALRSGAVQMVVAETAEPPALTPLRRLQLAAEAGGANTKRPPLGLILPPRAGTAGAVESRWRCRPSPAWASGQPARWRFERSYGKSGPPLVWETGVSDTIQRSAA